MSGPLLSRKVAKIIQVISSNLTISPLILKLMHVRALLHIPLK